MADFVPARTIEGNVSRVYAATGKSFVTTPRDVLTLTYDGIPGDVHSGLYRKSGVREPWYPRGTPMRNERQLSIVSVEEMGEVASTLGIDALAAEWIGGNLLIAGIPDLSLLPPRSILMFESGAAVRIDGDNGPCRTAGRSVAEQVGRPELEFAFVKAAKHKRGLVGWVEREGPVGAGDSVRIRVWEQALYLA